MTSTDIVCNVNGTDGTGVETIDVTEGDTITVGWDPSGHPGPITHFLFGPVDDASAATGVGSWVKIDELDYVDGEWANAIMEENGGNYTFTLPTGLESGEYLLRSEMLALHAAETIGGAQFYIGCAQIKITGTGGGCSPSIELPGAYDAEDDDIYIPDVYNGFDPTTYSAPGGDVAVCGGSGSSQPVTTAPEATSTSAASVPAVTTTATTSAVEVVPTSSAEESTVVPTTSTVEVLVPTSGADETSAAPTTLATLTRSTIVAQQPTTSTAIALPSAETSTVAASSSVTGDLPSTTSQPATGGSGTVALYGQCGGINYTGSTTCASGATCFEYNPYYSQCISSA